MSPHLLILLSQNSRQLMEKKIVIGVFNSRSRFFQNRTTIKSNWVPIKQLISSVMATLHPTIKWAQRKDRVFIEVPLRDIKDQKIDLTPHGISFSAESSGKNYSFNVEFFDEVVPETSKWTKTGLHLSLVLTKKDQSKGYWVRLTKQPLKSQYIQCDWNKWVDDEDEEQEDGQKGLGGFDPEAMNNFNDSDSDDEKEKVDDLDKQQPIVNSGSEKVA